MHLYGDITTIRTLAAPKPLLPTSGAMMRSKAQTPQQNAYPQIPPLSTTLDTTPDVQGYAGDQASQRNSTAVAPRVRVHIHVLRQMEDRIKQLEELTRMQQRQISLLWERQSIALPENAQQELGGSGSTKDIGTEAMACTQLSQAVADDDTILDLQTSPVAQLPPHYIQNPPSDPPPYLTFPEDSNPLFVDEQWDYHNTTNVQDSFVTHLYTNQLGSNPLSDAAWRKVEAALELYQSTLLKQ